MAIPLAGRHQEDKWQDQEWHPRLCFETLKKVGFFVLFSAIVLVATTTLLYGLSRVYRLVCEALMLGQNEW